MPMAFTIDGLPPGMTASYGVPPAGRSSTVMSQALGYIRVAAYQGLKGAAEEFEKVVDDKLLGVRIGVGIAAAASVLALLVALASVGSKPCGARAAGRSR